MKIIQRTLCAFALVLIAAPGWGEVTIGTGGAISLGGGTLDLGGGNLTINGALSIDDGTVTDARNVSINGNLNGGTGSLQLGGSWLNAGSFDAGTGSIHFDDALGNSAQLTGNSDFHDLSLISDAGGTFVLQSGSIQRISHLLTILGVSGQPVQIESSLPPQIAELFLEAGGTQNIEFVGVSNVHATGQRLAPDQTNQGGSGNDSGWFGTGIPPIIIPTLSVGGLSILILSLMLLGVIVLRRTPSS